MQPFATARRDHAQHWAEPHADFAAAVIEGLSQSPKSLPCRYLYDAEGSALFEQITRLPEYYPTRVETEILTRHAPDIAAGDGSGSILIEFGAGSSRKTEILLAALSGLVAYVPIDVSLAALSAARRRLATRFPALDVRPIHSDFTQPMTLPGDIAQVGRIGFFPGSTIGNFEPIAAVGLLSTVRELFEPDGRLIIGVDLIKDVRTLLRAYDDSAGVTAAFNLNMLARINRTFGPTFDISSFEHQAIYDRAAGRIEMHLVSRSEQTVRLLGQQFRFARGETIHTESSHKYTIASFAAIAQAARWQARQSWTDAAGLFSVHELTLA